MSKMIPYIEVIDKNSLLKFEMAEPSECWFELSFYDVGEFEIYCAATIENLSIFEKGHYVKIPNKPYIWVITSVEYLTTENRTRMISVKGKEAKWLLNYRVIQKPLDLSSYSLLTATQKLFNDNVGTNAGVRRIDHFEYRRPNINVLIDSGQATRGNLLTFMNDLIKTYEAGATVIWQDGTMYYTIRQGDDLTNSVKFSQSLDNLLSSSYLTNDEELGTNILVVSTVDNVDYTKTYDKGQTGVDRKEILLSSNLSTKYEDAGGTEHELDLTNAADLATYQGWLNEEGKKELSNHLMIEEINGTIDIFNSRYEFDVNFKLGDIVRIQDEYFNFFVDKRIIKYTIKQDAEGYGESADYGN